MVVGGGFEGQLASCAAKLWSGSLVVMQVAAILLARDLSLAKPASVGFIS
jgi:hypothetical protein